MSRKWWFTVAAMLVTATTYRDRLRANPELASSNVRDFDLPSAGAEALISRVTAYSREHLQDPPEISEWVWTP